MGDLAEVAVGLMFAAAFATGLCSGFVGGVFGIGGGIVTVPVLYLLLRLYGLSEDLGLKTAVGTSLAVILVTSLRALAAHSETGKVDHGLLRAWMPWIGLGAAAGGVLVRWTPDELLASIFILGAIIIAARRLTERKATTAKRIDLSSRALHIPIGIGAGLFSSLMGLGGGAVGVMVMRWSGRPLHEAVATASGFGVAVAVPGALGFMIAGASVDGQPPGSVGYVSLPAFAAVALAAGLTAPIGARVAHRLDGALLGKLFAVYIAVAAIALLADMVS